LNGHGKGHPEVIYSIATRLGISGLGLVSYNAVKALNDSGYLKKAVTYGNRSDIPGSKVLSLPGNPAKLLFFLPKSRYRPMRKGFLDFMASRHIKSTGCDIFHGWNNQARRSMEASRAIGARTILECGSTFTAYKEKLLEDEYRRFGLDAARPPEYARKSSLEEFDMADYIFLPSEFARKTFTDAGFDPGRIFVINRAVDSEKYSPGKKQNGGFKVLYVGRITLRKGVQYLLEAWKTLNLKEAELVLVGGMDDSFRPVAEKYAGIDGVSFTGHLKDTSTVYGDASVFVFPSLEEGSAKVTYEAMASGLPVITTANSGSVARDGRDGFIVPIRDAGAVRERILYFHENPEKAEEMGRSASEHIRQYSWHRYRETLINAYKRVIES
jgi:glycosyltransferase involved in cell wall biosynthesis